MTMETSTNRNGYGISMGAIRAGTSGKADFSIRTHDASLSGVERLRISSSGEVGIGNVSPKAQLQIVGGGDGQAFGGKNIAISENWTTVLTIGLADHESCYVKMTLNGVLTNHSGMMYLGEFMISNGGTGGYNEPGFIIREVDTMGGPSASPQNTNKIESKLVEDGDTVKIQSRFNDIAGTSTMSATANLNFHIMGEFDTIA